MASLDLITAVPLDGPVLADLAARAARGEPGPSPEIQGYAVGFARDASRRFALWGGGVVVPGLVVGVVATGRIGSVLPVIFALLGVAAAMIILLREARRLKRLHRIATVNLAALLDTVEPPPARPLTVRGRRQGGGWAALALLALAPLYYWVSVQVESVDWWDMIVPTITFGLAALVGYWWLVKDRFAPRPPVRIEPAGLAFPRVRLVVPWDLVTSVELDPAPDRSDPAGKVVWRLREVPAGVPEKVRRHLADGVITVDAGDLNALPETVILASRAYLR